MLLTQKKGKELVKSEAESKKEIMHPGNIIKDPYVHVKYNAGYWSLVFPLGVYTVCTLQLADVLGLDFLKRIPEVSIFIAWAAWIVTFAGMCFELIKLFFIPKTA